MLDIDGDELRAPEGADESQEQNGAVALSEQRAGNLGHNHLKRIWRNAHRNAQLTRRAFN
jgi:hypothetical protein